MRVGRGADGRDVDHFSDTGFGGKLGDVRGAERLRALEALWPALVEHSDQVDDRVGILERAADRGPVADIGLHELDLADVAGEPDVAAEVWPAHRNAHPPALPAEGADDMASEEARAAENGDDLAGHWGVPEPFRSDGAIDQNRMRKSMWRDGGKERSGRALNGSFSTLRREFRLDRRGSSRLSRCLENRGSRDAAFGLTRERLWLMECEAKSPRISPRAFRFLVVGERPTRSSRALPARDRACRLPSRRRRCTMRPCCARGSSRGRRPASAGR